MLGYVDVKSQDDKGVFVVISVGESRLRKRIAEKLMENPNLKFLNLIMGDTSLCPDIKIRQACIISMDSGVSTNVTFGDFIFLGMSTLVCHDGEIGDFSTQSPEAKLAGQVTVGKKYDLGLGTKVNVSR